MDGRFSSFTRASIASRVFNNSVGFYNLTDCTYTWTRYENTNVEGGQRVTTANTLAECQAACISNASCTGVDWTDTNECWMSGPWSGQRNDGTNDQVTHYDLRRDCKGQALKKPLHLVHCLLT